MLSDMLEVDEIEPINGPEIFRMRQYLEKMSAGFNSDIATRWFDENTPLAYQLAIGYIILMYVGERVMKQRDPVKLDYILIMWNLSLALFSIVATIGVLPDFLNALRTVGFSDSYCKTGKYYEGANGYWVYLFIISKAFELGDSVFLVLRKRKLIFLHVYHHATVLVYTWLAYPQGAAALRWGVGMNLLVHSVMYFYFLLRSLKIKTPGWVAQCITSFQILQFVIGVYVTFDITYRTAILNDGTCDCTPWLAWLQFFLYASYLLLFANFFYHAYVKPKKAQEKKE